MLSAPSLRARGPRAHRLCRAGASGLALAIAALTPGQASAQELVHRFIDPSFGGNPFYSDHLLSIANIDRPEKPTAPVTPPDETERLIDQLQSSFNADVQSQIFSAIRNAQPGQTGNFTLGNTQISFTRSTTETRITFLNNKTGESRLIVIPVQGASTSSSSTLGFSAEQLLGSSGASLAAPTNTASTDPVLGNPPY